MLRFRNPSRLRAAIMALIFAAVVVALLAWLMQRGDDRDGSAGVIHSQYASDSAPLERSCVRDAAGGFTCGGFNKNDTSQGLAVGDIDGDGDPDVVLANDNMPRTLCLNDDSARGYSCSDFGGTAGNMFDVALGDLDSDGDLDAVFANFGVNQICLNDGSGFPACTDLSSDGFQSFNVALGDVNNDTNLDAVFSNSDGGSAPTAPYRVCLGDGRAGFSCSDIGSESGTDFNGVDLGDVDSDGNLDAVFSNTEQQRVCLGDGAAGFACNEVDSEIHPAKSVALGDLNGDGDLDAAFSSARVCLGDGTGGFACSDMPVTATSDNFDIDIGDVDGDGNLDVAFADTEAGNPVCLGDGTGSFSACTSIAGGEQTTGVVIVDAP